MDSTWKICGRTDAVSVAVRAKKTKDHLGNHTSDCGGILVMSYMTLRRNVRFWLDELPTTY